MQVSYFNRYSQLHFYPDPIGDLVFNGVASDVYRQSFVNGIQEDTAWRVGYAHTLRFGFSVERGALSGQQHIHRAAARPDPANPSAGTDRSRHSRSSIHSQDRLADRHLSSGRVEDHQPVDPERRIAVRPDVSICRCQPAQPAHQPDLEAVRRHHVPRRLRAKLHAAAAGDRCARPISRWFTPPTAPANTQTPEVPLNSPVLPERSHVFDVGVVQKIYPVPGLEVGVDGYYKIARDLLDDGQFGAAYVLNGFNYDARREYRPRTQIDLHQRQLPRLRQLAWAKQIATNDRIEPVSVRRRTNSTISPATISTPTTPRS